VLWVKHIAESTFDWFGYKFESGVADPKMLKAEPGIYLAWANRKVLDIGEAEDVQARIANHDRRDCWLKHAAGATLYYGAHYMPGESEQARRDLELKLRSKQDYPCGMR
jgi:hypothetical protein